MGNDGGGGVLSTFAGNVKLPSLHEVINSVVNYGSGGFLGYDASKNAIDVKKGVIPHTTDEVLGAVTGRNLQRDAQAKADARVTAEEQQRERDRKLQGQQDEQSDRNASLTAQGLRNTAAIRSGSAPGSYQSLGADERDFLGL